MPSPRTRSFSPWRVPAVILAVPVIAMIGISSASAGAPIQNEHYSGSDSLTECGGYAGVDEFSGVVMIKDATPATNGQFFYFSDNYSFREVITNPANGKWFVVRGNGIVKESQARMTGDIVNSQTREAGQPFVVENSSGKVVLRDRGLIVQSYVFDTRGDSQPGADLISGPELVKVSGPHPGFADTFDFCTLADQLIG